MKNKHFITTHDSFEKYLTKELMSIDEKVRSKIQSISVMDGFKFDTVFLLIYHSFQSLLSGLSLQVQWGNQLKEFKQLIRDSKNKTDVLHQESLTLKEKQRKRTLNNRANNLGYLEHLMRKWSYMKIIIVIFTFGELVINYSAFLVIAPNVISAIVLAFSLGIALVLLAHFIGQFIRENAKTITKQILYWTITISVMSLVFYFIAELRMSYLQQMGQGSLDDGYVKFLIFNMLFFICSTIITIYHSPSAEQKMAYLQNKKEANVSKTQEDRIKAIEKELSLIPKAISEKEQLLTGLLVYLNEQEKHIGNIYHQTIRSSILEYSLQKGETMKTPSIPKLTFQYNSINIYDYE